MALLCCAIALQEDFDRLLLSTDPFMEQTLEALTDCMEDLGSEQQRVRALALSWPCWTTEQLVLETERSLADPSGVWLDPSLAPGHHGMLRRSISVLAPPFPVCLSIPWHLGCSSSTTPGVFRGNSSNKEPGYKREGGFHRSRAVLTCLLCTPFAPGKGRPECPVCAFGRAASAQHIDLQVPFQDWVQYTLVVGADQRLACSSLVTKLRPSI